MSVTSRLIVAGVLSASIASASAPAWAVRVAPRPLLLNRAAISGYVGGGLPVGEFSDSRPGFGNHESWPLDWAAEVEYFAGRTWSLGFSFASSTYEDKDIPSLETNLNTYSGFVRVIVPTATVARPYLRAGMGVVNLEFLDPFERFEAESSFSLHVGGGLLWVPGRWLGINAQVLYYNGSTDEAFVSGFSEPTVVGFDVQYWVFSAGVSLLFP